jgi:hypothetical protein
VAASAETPLEQLVRDELHGPISELVRKVVVELVHEQLNGNGAEMVLSRHSPHRETTNGPAPTPSYPPTSTDPTTKICRICERELPASRFDRGRRQCRACRSSRARKRQEQEAADPEG